MGHLSAQIPAVVDVRQVTYDSSATINIRWSANQEQDWYTSNQDRLEVPALKTNIKSAGLKKAGGRTTTYAFDFQEKCTVELMVTLNTLAEGESLILVHTESGSVMFDFTSPERKSFLTPAFDPATTILVWRRSESAPYRSDFSIDNIYYQPLPAGRALDIGFGTSLACHPNTVCKQDSMMQLISGSAVRIRLVMEEGIGWCTGSFVNTTRNDKTPYLLTAFHCQYNFTPRYDMWRFDFQYASSTCTNPAVEPAYFSLTGCALVSAGQASDYLLVLLEDQIPVNQDMTFAGWDMDDTARPDTSYLIHHPNADIRKISTCTNEAIIHPNQIGWSEGYSTPANHHLRFKFTEGGHEPGSSGGPVFNEDGYLVGQLHGGTAGCETTNNAFIGRLSKSWNLGATPQERLRDWLDPDQTGLTKIPSIENIASGDLVDLHGLVTDPKGVPVKNVIIKISGSLEETIVTSDDGTFTLNGISRSGHYTFTPEKTDNPSNGINAIDLIAIQKHLLGKLFFTQPWQLIAADATNNNELSVGDIVLLQRLLLGKIQSLPSSPSWRFDPPQIVIDSMPPGEPVEVQLMGIKIGDVNGTSDPKK